MGRFVWLLVALLTVACGETTPLGSREESAEVILHTTSGDIRLELDGRTPRHRDNFLKLVRNGSLDSLLFHRVIRDFMIQSGDPTSRNAKAGEQLGDGEVGNQFPAEIVYPELSHLRGALAAAREGDELNPQRLSSGSQFYIVWGQKFDDQMLDQTQMRISAATNGRVTMPDSLREAYKRQGGTPHLDGQYTVFGRVLGGMDVVDAIQAAATDSLNRPISEVRILSAEVVREPQKKR